MFYNKYFIKLIMLGFYILLFFTSFILQ